MDVVKEDMKKVGVTEVVAENRVGWRWMIRFGVCFWKSGKEMVIREIDSVIGKCFGNARHKLNNF